MLGKWALIDIETTGVNPANDDIIDVGFLQFDGVKLVSKYSSLVRSEIQLSHFIQKLTGINQTMISSAPTWDEVEGELGELEGHELLAHNSAFEESFLGDVYNLTRKKKLASFSDSLLILGILFPHKESFKLDAFIREWGIRENEKHRGYEDSLDLLKVLLVAVEYSRRTSPIFDQLPLLFEKYGLKENFWYKFLLLSGSSLFEISEQIEFDLQGKIDLLINQKKEFEEYDYAKRFNLEFSMKNVEDIFTNTDKNREVMPNFVMRNSQFELAKRVGQAFNSATHAIIQAPTGTGKTLGYLVPSAMFALSSKKQVLVATATKVLQAQAIHKDLPLMRKILGLNDDELKVVELIGSSNHLCESLFYTDEDQGTLFESNDVDERIAKLYFESLFLRNEVSPLSEKITRKDISFVFKKKNHFIAKMEKDYAVDYRSCTGFMCPHKDSCSYYQGLQEAKEANIVIGNHSLMFSWPSAFPRPEYIIVDEAHKVEESITDANSFNTTQEDLDSLLNALTNKQGLGSLFYLIGQVEEGERGTSMIDSVRNEAESVKGMLADHLILLPDIIEAFFKKSSRYTSEYNNELPMIEEGRNPDDQALSILHHFQSIENIVNNLSDYLTPYLEKFENRENDDKWFKALTRFTTFCDSVADIAVKLKTILESDPKYIHSINYSEGSGYSLLSAPIDVGLISKERLLEISSSVVFTSATLASSDGSLGQKNVEWATGILYTPAEKRFRSGLYLPPVFDYEQNSKLYFVNDLPSTFAPNFVETIISRFAPMIEELGGKTLFLFSARKRFEQAVELLLERFSDKIPVYIQGMGTQVVDEFKKNGGILVGMESFSEGIDIPGDELQFIFIDKIPDLRGDQLINGRRDFFDKTFGNEFLEYFLSYRARNLQQKLGRLIRREGDFGGIIVTDNRINRWKSRTVNNFFQLLSPYRPQITTAKDAIEGIKDFIIN